MLTERETLNLKSKLLSARAALVREHPFFGLLLMYLKYIAIPDMEQISTNGECIFFSPDSMKKYTHNELKSLLCHLVLHIITGDIKRSYEYKGDEYHYLRDVEVNKKLKAYGVGTNYVYVRSIPTVQEDTFFHNPPQRRVMVDTDEYWSAETNFIDNGLLILETTEAVSPKHSLVSICNRILQNPGRYGVGDVPQGLMRDWQNAKEGRLDWKKILNNFVQEETFDYSFSPPDRRLEETGFLFPDFNEKDVFARKVLFMVDTSGSMSEKELNEVYAELRRVVQQFQGRLEGKVGFFDAEVIPPKLFANIKDLSNIHAAGGGGTSFKAIFQYLKNSCMDDFPDCIIIFTDGYAPFPNRCEAMNIPVLWLINNNKVTPPWGRVIRMVGRNN